MSIFFSIFFIEFYYQIEILPKKETTSYEVVSFLVYCYKFTLFFQPLRMKSKIVHNAFNLDMVRSVLVLFKKALCKGFAY